MIVVKMEVFPNFKSSTYVKLLVYERIWVSDFFDKFGLHFLE